MLPMLALAAAMSVTPAQGGLDLVNDRLTFGGEFGPVRRDTPGMRANEYLPGDLFFVAFDIVGLKSDSQGKVAYFMGMVVTHDATGKVIYEHKPSESNAILPLGASRLPGRAFVGLGLDLKGPCTWRLTVTDKATNAAKTIEKRFVVRDPMFAIVRFHTSFDPEGDAPAPMSGIAGQVLYLNFNTVGFTRDRQTGQPHNQVELRVLDQNGRPTTAEGLVYEIKNGVKDDVTGLEWHLMLPLNAPGRYRVKLTATDKLAPNRPPYTMEFDVKVDDSVK
jgi:hypothetical protein